MCACVLRERRKYIKQRQTDKQTDSLQTVKIQRQREKKLKGRI